MLMDKPIVVSAKPLQLSGTVRGPIVVTPQEGDSGDTTRRLGYNQPTYKVKLVANGKTFNMLLPPSIESKHPGRSNPLQLPGLQIKANINISKLKIPGFFPIYQNLGVESLTISMSGMFTGYDGTNLLSAANWENSVGIGQSNVEQGQDSFASASELYDFAVNNKALVQVTIYTSDGSFIPKQSTSTAFRDSSSNISFKGYIKEFEQVYIRQDRNYYLLRFEIVDFGNSNSNNKCKTVVKSDKTNNTLLNKITGAAFGLSSIDATTKQSYLDTISKLLAAGVIAKAKSDLLIDLINKGNNISTSSINTISNLFKELNTIDLKNVLANTSTAGIINVKIDKQLDNLLGDTTLLAGLSSQSLNQIKEISPTLNNTVYQKTAELGILQLQEQSKISKQTAETLINASKTLSKQGLDKLNSYINQSNSNQVAGFLANYSSGNLDSYLLKETSNILNEDNINNALNSINRSITNSAISLNSGLSFINFNSNSVNIESTNLSDYLNKIEDYKNIGTNYIKNNFQNLSSLGQITNTNLTSIQNYLSQKVANNELSQSTFEGILNTTKAATLTNDVNALSTINNLITNIKFYSGSTLNQAIIKDNLDTQSLNVINNLLKKESIQGGLIAIKNNISASDLIGSTSINKALNVYSLNNISFDPPIKTPTRVIDPSNLPEFNPTSLTNQVKAISDATRFSKLYFSVISKNTSPTADQIKPYVTNIDSINNSTIVNYVGNTRLNIDGINKLYGTFTINNKRYYAVPLDDPATKFEFRLL